jgi:hypothetical protein
MVIKLFKQVGCLNRVGLLIFLLVGASSAAEGQTTPSPASKKVLSFDEQKAEWAKETKEAEKYGLTFDEQKAVWARETKEAEKYGLTFDEQKAVWARETKKAENYGLSFHEQKAKWAREAENGPKDLPWDRGADGNRPWDRKEAPPPKK